MTFENQRYERITRILELLANNPHGLNPNTIAKECNIITEITKKRFFMYLSELAWAGKVVILKDGKVKLKK